MISDSVVRELERGSQLFDRLPAATNQSQYLTAGGFEESLVESDGHASSSSALSLQYIDLATFCQISQKNT
jgi:hypothetical protein